jgi:two-component system LytT family response regulator
MIKAIIIDDEQHCTDRVVALLKSYSHKINLVGEFSDVDSGIEGIKTLQPDVVFLDVQIHDQTGFDVLKAFVKHPFEVVFTTAFESYAVQAFKFSAIDYLLKPIDVDDFEQAIQKVSEKLETKDFSKKVVHLLHNVSKQDSLKKISIPTLEGYVFIDVSEIIRCQADVNYTYVFTRNDKKIMVSKTLKYFDGLLSNCGFFRVHNSHLINLQYVKGYIKGKGGYVTLEDGATVEVSTRRKDDFIKMMEQFS